MRIAQNLITTLEIAAALRAQLDHRGINELSSFWPWSHSLFVTINDGFSLHLIYIFCIGPFINWIMKWYKIIWSGTKLDAELANELTRQMCQGLLIMFYSMVVSELENKLPLKIVFSELSLVVSWNFNNLISETLSWKPSIPLNSC